MPRITTGSAKNKNIEVPDVPNIRVVQDIYKLALFSIISDRILNTECLDLYAGSGSLGLEALSRGARFCDFVDESRKAVTVIQKNINSCGFQDKSHVHYDNATKYVANTHKRYDVIFADPFFDDLKHKFLMQNLEEILNENGLIAFSHGKELDINEQIAGTQLKIETERRFGKSHLTILTH